MSLYKVMDLDHFTIEEKYQFLKWTNIFCCIRLAILNEWLLDILVYYFLYI